MNLQPHEEVAPDQGLLNSGDNCIKASKND
jgi:hypothetical protein